MDTMQELGQKYGVKVTDMSERGVRGIHWWSWKEDGGPDYTQNPPPVVARAGRLKAAASQFCYSLLGCGVCDVLFGSSVDRNGHKRGL